MLQEDEAARPDEKCVMTYVSEFPLAFLTLNPSKPKPANEIQPTAVTSVAELSEEELAKSAEAIKLAQEEADRKKKEADEAQRKAEEARIQKDQVLEKKKEKESAKAEIDAKEG
jgi:hypothetical protein